MSNSARQAVALAMQATRSFASAAAGAPPRKVAVLGAAGGIGQPLSMLMKMNSQVSHLSLYDIMGTKGVAADCSHINSKAQAQGFEGPDSLGAALRGADLVIIPAGVPRKPGMTRDDLFNINAGIVKDLITACGKHCPGALLNIISNPVNSTVPIAVEVLKKMGVYDKRKVMGVTTLDVVRAKTFYAELKGLDVHTVDVPVIGGHAGVTILPLFSQATPKASLTEDELVKLTKRTQEGGTEVVEAKAGKGSATLSMAYAAALFADSCLRGLNGTISVNECSYVESSLTDAPFFASRIRLSTEGVDRAIDLGNLTDFEKAGLEAMMPELIAQIEKGYKFAKENA